MGVVLNLLLRLIRLSFLADSKLILFSPDLLLADYFGDLIPEQTLHDIAATLRRVESASPAERLRALAAVCSRLGEPADMLVERAAAACRACDLLLAVHRSGAGAALTLRIDTPELLTPVQQLSVAPTAGTPLTIIIGGPARSLRPSEFTVSLPDKHPIEQRTEISYGLSMPFPRIMVKLPVRRAGQDLLPAGRTWVQRPRPEYDLDVFTYRERHVGSLRTQALHPPYTVAGGDLTLVFEGPEMQLLSTEVRATNNDILIRLIRVVETPRPQTRASAPAAESIA